MKSTVKKHIISISFWRLTFYVLKRLINIIKVIDKLKLQSLSIPCTLIFYVLHLFRAILRIVNYFYSVKNKNLGATAQLLFAFFKVFISIAMLMSVLCFNLPLISVLLSAFLVYSYLKVIRSVIIFGFSCYYLNRFSGDSPRLENQWSKNHYKENLKYNSSVLAFGVVFAILATLFASAVLAGGWLMAVGVLLCVVTVLDIGISIYGYFFYTVIPEPKPSTQTPVNSLIDVSRDDYYYRKCRSANLTTDNQANKIYLLKECFVKITILKNKLQYLQARKTPIFLDFFSEEKKIKTKIEGLKRLAASQLGVNLKTNVTLLFKVIRSLEEDDKALDEKGGGEHRRLIGKHELAYLKNNINELLKYTFSEAEFEKKKGEVLPALLLDNGSENTLWAILLVCNDKEGVGGRGSSSKLFTQSFKVKMSDSEDLARAFIASKKIASLSKCEIESEFNHLSRSFCPSG
ncbi:hypothetical protein [Rickettsiella endosymbiont of Dermanyssus gallinae]|uniref:hypothetical protein n=1 Tax=Rickettsiella endosymbiont of Dermanyssus gallinae TaxID=2856608 RepID=UPI001C5288A0|nr:hypothetical protein [Rickettsiella endosymbiont of Dermanyssus gallinae]